MQGIVFDDVNMSEVTITNANLTNCRIDDANLTGMTINGVLVSELFEAYNKVGRQRD